MLLHMAGCSVNRPAEPVGIDIAEEDTSMAKRNMHHLVLQRHSVSGSMPNWRLPSTKNLLKACALAFAHTFFLSCNIPNVPKQTSHGHRTPCSRGGQRCGRTSC